MESGIQAAAAGTPWPADHNLTAWAFDPALAVAAQVTVTGTVYLVKMHVAVATTITKLYWHVNTVATTPTAGRNEIGLYSAAGTRLAAVNVDAAVTSTGLKTTTITGQALAAGSTCWVGLVFAAATPPQLARGTGVVGSAGLINAGLTAANYRFAINGTGQNTLPASVTPGSATQGIPWWAAVAA